MPSEDSQEQTERPSQALGGVERAAGGCFSIVAYAYFFWSLPMQATAFMINLRHLAPSVANAFPYAIDYNTAAFASVGGRVVVDFALLALFAVPHSAFACDRVKREMQRHYIRPAYYRAFYVFKSSACLHLLLKYWQPIDDAALWGDAGAVAGAGVARAAVIVPLAVYAAGWLWLVTATFALDHFELFGLKDGLGVDFMANIGYGVADGTLVERGHYALCRHPIMSGLFAMLFAVPVMTVTHAVFSFGCATYILLAVQLLEEPRLRASFGTEYASYSERVPAYCPFTADCRRRPAAAAATPAASAAPPAASTNRA
jgi:F0F1-type ATP synthase membrane subunit c/vacuolar-type H+-ATPase subunit K